MILGAYYFAARLVHVALDFVAARRSFKIQYNVDMDVSGCGAAFHWSGWGEFGFGRHNQCVPLVVVAKWK